MFQFIVHAALFELYRHLKCAHESSEGETIAPKAQQNRTLKTIIIGHDSIIESHKFPIVSRGAVCISYIYIFFLFFSTFYK